VSHEAREEFAKCFSEAGLFVPRITDLVEKS
jgi:hypothetical protein